MLAGAVALVLVIFAVPVMLTATPRSCATCHEMKPYYDTWQKSSHRGAASNCRTCHVSPGALSLVAYELTFYREIAGHFMGAEVGGGSALDIESCQRKGCHSLNRQTSNSGDLRIGHREHIVDEGIACPRCHPGAVHEGIGGRTKLPPMKLCKSCHEDDMKKCTYCHLGKVVPEAPGTH